MSFIFSGTYSNHELVDRIDNSLSMITVWHHEALPSDAKQ